MKINIICKLICVLCILVCTKSTSIAQDIIIRQGLSSSNINCKVVKKNDTHIFYITHDRPADTLSINRDDVYKIISNGQYLVRINRFTKIDSTITPGQFIATSGYYTQQSIKMHMIGLPILVGGSYLFFNNLRQLTTARNLLNDPANRSLPVATRNTWENDIMHSRPRMVGGIFIMAAGLGFEIAAVTFKYKSGVCLQLAGNALIVKYRF